ncbi:hypothetical protein UlMin_010434 [Ulmus minor]
MAIISLMFFSVILQFFFPSFCFAIDSIRPLESISDGRSLISREGSFQLGFFSPGSSKNRYLGIWYQNIPVQTVVWVANRCNPISDLSGLLMMTNTGNLVLSGKNKSVVWSTNSSKQAQKPILQLLDSGNLVLRDEKYGNNGTYLWQSFDYPCDTWLPEMKIGLDLRTGLERSLSAWKNTNDPCPGDLTFGIKFEPHTFPEAYILKGRAKLYRTGPWNGFSLSGSPGSRENRRHVFTFVYNNNEVYFMYILKNKSDLSRFVMNQATSNRQRYTWVEADQTWESYSAVPRDSCDNYSRCGANGNCIIRRNRQICECLQGFKPKSQQKWKIGWLDGCVRNSTLSCTDKEKVEFVKFSGLKVPDTTHSWVNKSSNLKECRAKCLSNCSCMAYTNMNITGEGSGCVIWFGDLIDIRQIASGGQDLYIRMPYSELEKPKADQKLRKILIIVAVTGVFSGMLFVSYYIWRRIKLKANGGGEEDLDLPLFNLSIITTATENFSENNKLGEGGFGPVYRGKLEGGQEIAVKRLSLTSGQGVTEFKTEVKLTAKLQHRNLVKLLGCCIQEEEKMLVYEYMPNKSLDFFIFDQKQGKLLEWPRRFQIICGVARGLLYLHQDSRLRIIHRDLKASNVLLDKEMNPKISDFGLARTFGGDQTEGKTNRVIGTYGYMAPEYAFNGLFSIKSDVFSFGILVLEIVSGNRSRGFLPENHGLPLTAHAWTLMKQGKPFELIDSGLRDSNHLQEVLKCIHVGLLCVQQSPGDRPSMSSVVLMLGSESELPQPKPPGYFMHADLPSNKPMSSSTNTITISELHAR